MAREDKGEPMSQTEAGRAKESQAEPGRAKESQVEPDISDLGGLLASASAINGGVPKQFCI